MPAETDSIRLDKWLWAARFFKTRGLAQEAIAGGKVHVNDQRVKPGKEVKPGMRLAITKDNLHWDITITALSSQRRPAKEAALLYEEDPESHAKRQQQIIDEREMRALMPHNDPDHRPNKKERRMIHRFKQDF
ncbi:MAG: RNA-binding S4 domain-containing protein [Gammaproteobacteria bacterium]